MLCNAFGHDPRLSTPCPENLLRVRPPVAAVLVVCQDLKFCDSTRRIPVIAVTGYTNAELIEAAASVECVSVLLKPCTPEALLAEINRVLNISPPTSSPCLAHRRHTNCSRG